MVNILEPDDVVFAEIGARLHLDQLEIDLAGIGHAVNRADRQIDRLILVDENDFVVAGNFRRAAYHDPMFGAVEMLLQRQSGAGFYDDALDLITRALINRLEISPRPVASLML